MIADFFNPLGFVKLKEGCFVKINKIIGIDRDEEYGMTKVYTDELEFESDKSPDKILKEINRLSGYDIKRRKVIANN